jgi:outer membrane protein OmpA-like peptidoglycan-associated protein
VIARSLHAWAALAVAAGLVAAASTVHGQAGAASAPPAASGPFAGFRLALPAPQPEAIGEHDDFPYLPPLPGSAAIDSERGTQGLDVTTPDDDEAHVVGTATLARTYAQPPGTDEAAWLRAYALALRDAGWTIMDQERRAGDGARIVAHYAAGGRDLWARLAATQAQYSLAVADVGDDLGHLLARSCRVTVYGIDFVVDRPDIDGPAESVLMELRQLLRTDRAMRLQVIVHLDPGDVPNDAAGAKRLSQLRADAIRVWLARHRVDVDRLTAVGAGASQPLVPGDTEEQRVRNRRVELVKDGCR